MADYSKNYSEESFNDKVKINFKKAGVKVIYKALILYHVLKNNKTPTLDKALIVGALGYFILPFDVIPDFIIGLGYTDDLAVLLGAIDKVSANITDIIVENAKNDIDNLFGDNIRELLDWNIFK